MKRILLSLVLPIISFAASDLDLAIYKSPTHMSFSSHKFNAVVPNYMVNRSVREMKPEKLAAILNSGNGYLSFKECSDGEYAVDLHGRVKGGALFGAVEGAAAGGIVASEGSKMIFVCGSVACLFLAQGAVHVFAGADKGAVFRANLDSRYLPAVYAIAENIIGPVMGMAGAGAGAVAGSTLPI